MASLVGLDVERFLRDHWQKRPLLLRGALPGFSGVFSRDALFAQCLDETTPARFFSGDPDDGVLHGPFELDLENLPQAGWTVLISSLETTSDDAWALLDRFDFIPRARLDDLMVSFAMPGGGIGPHFDLYDVFLVQGEGKRRWRYADGPVDASLDEHASGPFDFEPDHDVVLEAGDVLYIPPRVPHDGEAVSACTTYSVGAAAPRWHDLAGEFLAFLSQEPERAGLARSGVYSDPGAPAPTARGALPHRLVDDATAFLSLMHIDAQTVAHFMGRLLTAPKPHTRFFPPPAEAHGDLAERLTAPHVVRLMPQSRALHDARQTLFLNGEAFELEGTQAFLALADHREAALPALLTDTDRALLAALVDAGWVRVVVDSEENVQG